MAKSEKMQDVANLSVFLRTPYNYDMERVSDETGLSCPEPSLAQQHMAEECDINVIVERFGLTGKMPNRQLPPLFGDFSQVKDYRSALDAIGEAESSFAELPAEIRSTFQNNPAGFVDFALDPANREILQKAGLLHSDNEYLQRMNRVSEVREAMEAALQAHAEKAGKPV